MWKGEKKCLKTKILTARTKVPGKGGSLGIYFTRFRPGEDLFQKFVEVCKESNIKQAVIISGIGSLCDVAFRDLKTGIDLSVNVNKTNQTEEYGPFELLTLEGNVVPLVGEFGNLKYGRSCSSSSCHPRNSLWKCLRWSSL